MAALGLGSALPRTANAVITEQELPDCPILPNKIGFVFLKIFSFVKSIFHKRGRNVHLYPQRRKDLALKMYPGLALPRTVEAVMEQELQDCPLILTVGVHIPFLFIS